jgi:ppGpp synthetase/RelA/SpoT-type nucleotidyltranferase
MVQAWKQLDDTLKGQVIASVDAYRELRPDLVAVTEHLRNKVADLFTDDDVSPLFVSARTKSVESFRQKASRVVYVGEETQEQELEFPEPLSQLHDLIGVRVIVLLSREVRESAALIKRQRNDFWCRSDREKDIGSLESGTYGYSSRHLILKPRGDEVVDQFLETHPEVDNSLVFEVQVRTVLAHAWSEIEHDIRFKRRDSRAWSPYLDRQFTASAAMLESVEGVFTDIDSRHQLIRSYWDRNSVGGEELTSDHVGEVWKTLWPHLERKSDDDNWEWALELLRANDVDTVRDLVELLDTNSIRNVRAALEHRYSPGPDRLLDDVLLWRFGKNHIERTAGDDRHRRSSLWRRLQQMRTYQRSLMADGGE